jgi:hypothetical protein
MIVGNPAVLAIESGITQAYERLSFRALGFFTIHVGGRRYGVCRPDATMLANSFDEVERRIAARGRHLATFAESDAGKIAYAFRNAVYADQQDESYWGIPLKDFCNIIYSGEITWAPDGDEAFDDGSYVLQFDVGDRVRVVAFKSSFGGLHDPATLSEAWLEADDFYGILQQWHAAFAAEWKALSRISEHDDGA